MLDSLVLYEYLPHNKHILLYRDIKCPKDRQDKYSIHGRRWKRRGKKEEEKEERITKTINTYHLLSRISIYLLQHHE